MTVVFVTLYVALCFLVGSMGRNRRLGYAFTVILSIPLTPLLMWIILYLASPKGKGKETK